MSKNHYIHIRTDAACVLHAFNGFRPLFHRGDVEPVLMTETQARKVEAQLVRDGWACQAARLTAAGRKKLQAARCADATGEET